jgi:hypothetical protein
MSAEERRKIVSELVNDFRSAKESKSQSVAVWMGLARRYMEIGANMNWAYCIKRAQACRPVMHVVTDLGLPGNVLELVLVPVAVETEE